MKPYNFGTIYEFKTKNFRIVLDALEDYDADLSWDDTGEVRQKLKAGEYVCFTARCRMFGPAGDEIASDYLGACIYSDIAEFRDNLGIKRRQPGCGSYFSDMIRTVCSEARKTICDMQRIKLRCPV